MVLSSVGRYLIPVYLFHFFYVPALKRWSTGAAATEVHWGEMTMADHSVTLLRFSIMRTDAPLKYMCLKMPDNTVSGCVIQDSAYYVTSRHISALSSQHWLIRKSVRVSFGGRQRNYTSQRVKCGPSCAIYFFSCWTHVSLSAIYLQRMFQLAKDV